MPKGLAAALARKDKISASNLSHLRKDCERPGRQWSAVLKTGLHSVWRSLPDLCVEIELGPLRA